MQTRDMYSTSSLPGFVLSVEDLYICCKLECNQLMRIAMNKPIKHVNAFFIISQIILPAFAMGSFSNNDIIWQASTNEIIKYIDQDTLNSSKNDHPAVLQTKDINTILASIKFYPQKEGNHSTDKQLKSVFAEQQTKLLGRYLEQGLKGAKPHQDIIFVMEKRVNRLSLLKPSRYFVAGRVFYKNNKLNIIIGDYDRLRNEAFEAVNDPTGTGHIHYSFDYGKRSRPSRFNKEIISVKGIENKRLNDTQRVDWLVIDVNVALKSLEHMAKIRNKDEMENRHKELMELLDSEDTIHIDAITSPEKVTHSVEERLIELIRLRNKDLITDEEYTQKRKQILDDL